MLEGFRHSFSQSKIAFAIMVAALGYFVDVYDLVVFSIVRVASLRDIGVPEDQILPQGVFILNMQMAGMLIGGLIWGVWGDKRGRLEALFGTILLYSLANIANAFVTDVNQYALCRFIAGIGLAGEIGVGITLVSELMSKETRGYGTALVAGIGVMGGATAAIVSEFLDWKAAYIIGGIAGLALLLMRISVSESGIFKATAEKMEVKRGSLRLLFTSWRRVSLYVRCILIGVPIWFVVGILATFSPEIARALGVTAEIKASWVVMNYNIGIAIGGVFAGFLSQWMESRRKVLMIFTVLALLLSAQLLSGAINKPGVFYIIYLPLGFFIGHWSVFLTVAAEQFGTNLRATVATSVPNFVRASTIIMTSAVTAMKPHLDLIMAVQIVGACAFGVAFAAIWKLKETHGVDLDFIEEKEPKKKRKKKRADN
jgi:MFS family permease